VHRQPSRRRSVAPQEPLPRRSRCPAGDLTALVKREDRSSRPNRFGEAGSKEHTRQARLPSHLRRAGPRIPSGRWRRLARFHIEEEDTRTAQLATLGYAPAEVDTAILSHLHEDHIGGLSELGGADLLIARRSGSSSRGQPRAPGGCSASTSRSRDCGGARSATIRGRLASSCSAATASTPVAIGSDGRLVTKARLEKAREVYERPSAQHNRPLPAAGDRPDRRGVAAAAGHGGGQGPCHGHG
jgi:hypothetical protein